MRALEAFFFPFLSRSDTKGREAHIQRVRLLFFAIFIFLRPTPRPHPPLLSNYFLLLEQELNHAEQLFSLSFQDRAFVSADLLSPNPESLFSVNSPVSTLFQTFFLLLNDHPPHPPPPPPPPPPTDTPASTPSAPTEPYSFSSFLLRLSPVLPHVIIPIPLPFLHYKHFTVSPMRVTQPPSLVVTPILLLRFLFFFFSPFTTAAPLPRFSDDVANFQRPVQCGLVKLDMCDPKPLVVRSFSVMSPHQLRLRNHLPAGHAGASNLLAFLHRRASPNTSIAFCPTFLFIVKAFFKSFYVLHWRSAAIFYFSLLRQRRHRPPSHYPSDFTPRKKSFSPMFLYAHPTFSCQVQPPPLCTLLPPRRKLTARVFPRDHVMRFHPPSVNPAKQFAWPPSCTPPPVGKYSALLRKSCPICHDSPRSLI